MIATVETPTDYRNRQAAISTRKFHTEKRNEKIQNRFNELYNVDRLRYDDVIKALCDEFCLEKKTIERVMKS